MKDLMFIIAGMACYTAYKNKNKEMMFYVAVMTIGLFIGFLK